MDKVNMTKNKNRRVFFRIYDEVNLFYHKIDPTLLTESQPAADDILKWPTEIEKVPQDRVLELPKLEKVLPEDMAPGLHFDENETRDVNISASGMAFNCEDSLKEGDYLAIRILLVSSMAGHRDLRQGCLLQKQRSQRNPVPLFCWRAFHQYGKMKTTNCWLSMLTKSGPSKPGLEHLSWLPS